VSRDGGAARIVHRLESEHDAPGLAVSPDGRDVVFIAPAADGFFQVFRLPLTGGTPVAVTKDPSHKTQAAWSPDGRQIAFTVWSYESQFWRRQ
jgi:TolB protein